MHMVENIILVLYVENELPGKWEGKVISDRVLVENELPWAGLALALSFQTKDLLYLCKYLVFP